MEKSINDEINHYLQFIETQLKPDLNKINSQLLNLNFHLEEL